MGPIEKHTPLRLTKAGYKKLCKLVSERDNGCIVCRSPNVQHHHVIFRSAGGEDTIDNLVCLCPRCHTIYAHGDNELYWRCEFLKYLSWPLCVIYKRNHMRELRDIYRLKKKGGD